MNEMKDTKPQRRETVKRPAAPRAIAGGTLADGTRVRVGDEVTVDADEHATLIELGVLPDNRGGA